MPTAGEIEAALFQSAPKELAMDWDNVGLLIGDPAREISRILVALDITLAVAEEAEQGGFPLIVAHHPVMNCRWTPVQSLRPDTPQGALLTRLVRSGTVCICMHTNLDRASGGVNDCLAEVLGLKDPEILPNSDGFCRMGHLSASMDLPEFAQSVSAVLRCAGVRYAQGGRPVFRVAVGGGACSEFAAAARDAGCDTFVTADVKYHAFQDAAAMGLNLLDAGHFPTEDPVCDKLIERINAAFPEVLVQKSRVHGDVIRFHSDSI